MAGPEDYGSRDRPHLFIDAFREAAQYAFPARAQQRRPLRDDYLPTQAIADFLATENDPPLDGIVFPSVQAAGAVLNVVLFHKAARVEPLDVPKGTEIEARTGQMYEEGWETEYAVIEQVPPAAEPRVAESTGWPAFADFDVVVPTSASPDYRESTLRVDVETIKVHQVRRVQVDATEFDVRRHRREKRALDF